VRSLVVLYIYPSHYAGLCATWDQGRPKLFWGLRGNF